MMFLYANIGFKIDIAAKITTILSSDNMKRRLQELLSGLAGRLEGPEVIKTEITKVLLQPLSRSFTLTVLEIYVCKDH